MSDNYFLNRIIVTTQLNTIILITKRFALEIKVNFHVNSHFLIIFRNVTNPNVFWNVFLSVDICFPCKTTDPFKAKNIFLFFLINKKTVQHLNILICNITTLMILNR